MTDPRFASLPPAAVRRFAGQIIDASIHTITTAARQDPGLADALSAAGWNAVAVLTAAVGAAAFPDEARPRPNAAAVGDARTWADQALTALRAAENHREPGLLTPTERRRMALCRALDALILTEGTFAHEGHLALVLLLDRILRRRIALAGLLAEAEAQEQHDTWVAALAARPEVPHAS